MYAIALSYAFSGEGSAALRNHARIVSVKTIALNGHIGWRQVRGVEELQYVREPCLHEPFRFRIYAHLHEHVREEREGEVEGKRCPASAQHVAGCRGVQKEGGPMEKLNSGVTLFDALGEGQP